MSGATGVGGPTQSPFPDDFAAGAVEAPPAPPSADAPPPAAPDAPPPAAPPRSAEAQWGSKSFLGDMLRQKIAAWHGADEPGAVEGPPAVEPGAEPEEPQALKDLRSDPAWKKMPLEIREKYEAKAKEMAADPDATPEKLENLCGALARMAADKTMQGLAQSAKQGSVDDKEKISTILDIAARDPAGCYKLDPEAIVGLIDDTNYLASEADGGFSPEVREKIKDAIARNPELVKPSGKTPDTTSLHGLLTKPGFEAIKDSERKKILADLAKNPTAEGVAKAHVEVARREPIPEGPFWDELKQSKEFQALTAEQQREVVSRARSDDRFGNLLGTSPEAAGAFLQIAARQMKQNPGGTESLYKNFDDVTSLLKANKANGGYHSAAPSIKEQIKEVLARDPSAASSKPPSLRSLLSNQEFQDLSVGDRTKLLGQMANMTAPGVPGMAGAAAASLTGIVEARQSRAEKLADVAQRLLEPGFDPEDLTDEEKALLPPEVRAKIDNTDFSDDDAHCQEVLYALLKDPAGSDVIRALHDRGDQEMLDTFYKRLVNEWGEVGGDEPDMDEQVKPMAEIIQGLDPKAAALFMKGVTDRVEFETKQENLLGALIEGVSVNAEIGAEAGDDKGKVTAKAGGSLSLAPLMKAMKGNSDNAYNKLVTRMARGMNEKQFGGRGWSDEEKAEFKATMEQGGAG